MVKVFFGCSTIDISSFFTFKCHMQKSVISIGKKGQLSRRQNTFKTQRPSSPSVTESEKKANEKWEFQVH